MQRAGTRGVPPKITRCLSEAGAVKLDCWPLSTFDPEYHGARRIEQPGRGKPTRGRGEKRRVEMSTVDKKSEISLPLEEAFTNEVYEGLNEWMEILLQYEKEVKYRVHICSDDGGIL